MDKHKLKELKALAEKATPGPWIYDEEDGTIEPLETVGLYSIIAEPTYSNDAAFIAAANPQIVLDLIAENERLEKMGDWLVNKIEQLCGSMMCEACECESNDCPYEKDTISWKEVAYRAVEKDQ